MKYNTGNIEKYESKNPLKRYFVKRLNNKIIALLHKVITDDNISILDVGCGEGFITELVRKEFKGIKRIVGVDCAREALEIAKARNPQIEFVEGSIYNLNFENNEFDIVICTEVLEHLENPQIAFKEIQRVGKKFLLITVPHEPWFRLGNLITLKNISRLGNPIDHVQHWTFYKFKKWIQKYTDSKNILAEKTFFWITILCDLEKRKM